MISIYSEVERGLVLEKLRAGRISGCGSTVPPLTPEDIDVTPTIVGQIGPEPFLSAMVAHPDFDIIVGGRAYDPAPYVAFCAFQALSYAKGSILSLGPQTLGGFTHMGKIMECGGLCAVPKSQSSLAAVYRDGTFDVRPLALGTKCTTASVAAHTLYEKSRPDSLAGPGGDLDLLGATYSSLSDGLSVRVKGAVFNSYKDKKSAYTVKLEGAKVVGYRTIFIGSFIDPVLISQLPTLLEAVKAYVAQQHEHVAQKWEIGFHTYGNERVPSGGSPLLVSGPVFLVGEALAETQALATSVAFTARTGCTHGSYKGQKATSGNFGFGLGGPGQLETGKCAEFSLYHLMELEEGEEDAAEGGSGDSDRQKELGGAGVRALFRWEVDMVGSGKEREPRQPGKTAVSTETKPQPQILSVTDGGRGSSEQSVLAGTHLIGDLARVIRSKNAGPYEVTVDVIFDNETVYDHVKRSGVLSPQYVAELYATTVGDIIWCGFFDPALAFKVTLPRMREGKHASAGGFMENDMHGSQQHRPLMLVEVDFGL